MSCETSRADNLVSDCAAAVEDYFERLRDHIELELRANPQGLDEYALLKRLRALGVLGPGRFDDSLALFQIHFSLFHALYTLRDLLLAQSGESLSISPLSIRLSPGRSALNQDLDVPDALREYYLDLDNLRETGREEVDAMLNGFWKKFDRQRSNGSSRQRALATLGLTDPVDKAAIKRRYRSLVMQHHPDRGGDTAEFQAINEALRALI